MGITLLFLGPKGGSGKSSHSRNIAAAAAADGLRVLGLDADDQGTFSAWATDRQQHDDVPLIEVRFCGIDNSPQALAECGDGYDLIVIDTPTAIEKSPEQIRFLIDASDMVVVPCQPSIDDVRSVRNVMITVQELGKTAAFVMNRIRPRVLETEAARRELGAIGPVIATSIPDTIEIQRAMAAGLGVVETGGKGADEFTAEWNEIKRIVGLVTKRPAARKVAR
jgi:chromosome partitioning protein